MKINNAYLNVQEFYVHNHECHYQIQLFLFILWGYTRPIITGRKYVHIYFYICFWSQILHITYVYTSFIFILYKCMFLNGRYRYIYICVIPCLLLMLARPSQGYIIINLYTCSLCIKQYLHRISTVCVLMYWHFSFGRS